MSVQKYVIKKTSGNFTTFLNKVLQGLKNYEALGFYVYMASLPHGWVFNKKQLAEHANIGRDKVNKLIKILVQHNLCKSVQIKDEKGRFAHFELEVLDGSSFKINDLENPVHPFTEKPFTENQLLENRTYKENINKTNKEHKTNISCASGDAHVRFDEFWKSYPKKKNKERAKKEWDKKKLDPEKINIILKDIENRKRLEHQWQTSRFIPHPSRYLAEELWTDELINMATPTQLKSNQASTPQPQEYGPGHPRWEILHGNA